ncbi:MAG: hypothetical protein KAH22_00825 [Thiotrichaceae bacterium]|nr:hypothetical protein [Thiotrichaceae bacterium]
MHSLISFIPVLPLLVVLYIGIAYLFGWNRNEQSEKLTGLLSQLSIGLVLLILLIIDIQSLMTGHAPGHIVISQWLASGNTVIHYSLYLDALGLSIGTLVALLLLVAIRFSVNYLHREVGFQRFFMVLQLFASGMLLIVLSGNVVFTFIGWEMAGISSYLLIAYAYDRPVATAGANYAFISNRFGDAGFLFALFLCFQYFGTANWEEINNESLKQSNLHLGMLLIAFLVAALAKSALFPFVTWVSRALEGPTPSSTIFYGSLMTHAGIFLIIRLELLFVEVPFLMWMLVLLGVISALYGWLSGLVQTDIKSSLMFSTTAQSGLMLVECGLGYFELAAWHLVIHAIWRTWQFLSSPALMHMVSRPARPVPAWLRKSNFLYTAALQRFWVDHFTERLLLRPTQSLSSELRDFDEKVINTLVGQPSEQGGLSGLKLQRSVDRIGRGRGLSGRLMETVAAAFEWFEEHLILKGGGDGLIALVNHIGKYMLTIEELLSQPRYLVLLVALTFVVVL